MIKAEMTIEQAVETLNAHMHRGRGDWKYADGSVRIFYHETMKIHPIDAKIIAAYYWHKLDLPETTESNG